MSRKHLPWLVVPFAILLLSTLRGPVPAREPEASPEVEAAIAALRAAKSCDDEAVGEGGDRSDTYQSYEVLRDGAPARRLVLLTDDERPVLRCYALRALAEKHADVDVFAILWRHLDDLAVVETFRGCIVMDEKVADVMIRDVRPRLSPEQERRLVEQVLRSGDDLDERSRLLLDDRLPEDLLPLARTLAMDGDDDALVALARHRKPKDVVLLRSRLSTADPVRSFARFEAAALHADPALMPVLETLVPRTRAALGESPPQRLRFYFRAVAAQGGDRAAALLRDLLETPDLPDYRSEACARALFEAVREQRDPAFDPLLRDLWKNHGQLDATVAELLHEREPDWVRATAEADLRTDVNRLPEGAVGALLGIVARTDRGGAVDLVAQALPRADVHRFGALSRVASDLRDARLIEPLFHAYETRTNPHSYLAAAKALLAYDRPEIDVRLEAGVKKAPAHGKGWGGEALSKLLAEKPRGD